MLVNFIAVLSLILSFYFLIRVKENQEIIEDRPSLRKTFCVYIPKLLTNTNSLKFLLYLTIYQYSTSFSSEVMGQRLTQKGINITDSSNMDTILIAPGIAVSILSSYFYVKGKYLTYGGYLLFIATFFIIMRFGVLWYLIDTQNSDISLYALYVINILDLISNPVTTLQIAFYMLVADEKIGGSAITFYSTFNNLVMDTSTTVSLRVADWFPIKPFGVATCVI